MKDLFDIWVEQEGTWSPVHQNCSLGETCRLRDSIRASGIRCTPAPPRLRGSQAFAQALSLVHAKLGVDLEHVWAFVSPGSGFAFGEANPLKEPGQYWVVDPETGTVRPGR